MPTFEAHPTDLTRPRHLRADEGRARRDAVPRSVHRELVTAPARDPLAILANQNRDRLADLVPVRWGRMAQSPFAFLRGAAAVMAADLAQTPTTGLSVQTCGDAHLMNFGGFATPERREVFDLNDFDETLPGPWEWDVKRLAASAVVAGLDHGFETDTARSFAEDAVVSYATTMAELAEMDVVDTWYLQFEIERVIMPRLPKSGRAMARRAIGKMQHRTAASLMPKLTSLTEGGRRIIDQPPLIMHTDVHEPENEAIEAFFNEYFESLSPARRLLLHRFELVDTARKVVGVGSVGTRCHIALLLTGDGEPLFLQIKQAPPSVLEEFCGGYQGPAGRRVVEGQQLTQAAGDPLLGWASATAEGHGTIDFYVRQLRDMKYSVRLEDFEAPGWSEYLRLCGAALARAHCRTGDAAAIAGYVGGGTRIARAVAAWAVDYAAVTTADHALLLEAIEAGTIAAELGV
jgi:uncharacterized protein (DUF2252 family)